MNSVRLKQLGSIDLVDLVVISRFLGRDFLPHPLRRRNPSRFETRDEYEGYARTVPDRYQHGDLQVLKAWFGSYVGADIRVEAAVSPIPLDNSVAQIVAHRTGEVGYLAAQRPDEDVIDVFTLSPYDLGAAIADQVVLTRPGRHAEILIPEYAAATDPADGAAPVSIQHRVVTNSVVAVPRSEIAVFATVQSHWQPARRWGPDWTKNMLVWGRARQDGEYISVPAVPGRAKPMTRADLRGRIDRLIAEDVANVRESRGS